MDNQDNDNQTISINGVDYSLDEAQNLIETGKATLEAEQKYNTKFDKVWPEYNRSQTELQKARAELEETRKRLEQSQPARNDGNSSMPTGDGLTAEQKEAARRLGVVFKDDLNNVITEDKFNDLFEKAQSSYQAQQEGIRQVLNQAEKLENTINGSDGRPRFRKDIVMPYAASYGIGDLEEAYNRMYADDLESWKQAQVEASKKPSLRTLRSGGAKTPPEIKVTRDNLRDLLSEALSTSEE